MNVNVMTDLFVVFLACTAIISMILWMTTTLASVQVTTSALVICSAVLALPYMFLPRVFGGFLGVEMADRAILSMGSASLFTLLSGMVVTCLLMNRFSSADSLSDYVLVVLVVNCLCLLAMERVFSNLEDTISISSMAGSFLPLAKPV